MCLIMLILLSGFSNYFGERNFPSVPLFAKITTYLLRIIHATTFPYTNFAYILMTRMPLMISFMIRTLLSVFPATFNRSLLKRCPITPESC